MPASKIAAPALTTFDAIRGRAESRTRHLTLKYAPPLSLDAPSGWKYCSRDELYFENLFALSYEFKTMSEALTALEKVGIIKIGQGVEFTTTLYDEDRDRTCSASDKNDTITGAPDPTAATRPPVPVSATDDDDVSTPDLQHAQSQRPLMSPKQKRRRSSNMPKLAKNMVKEVLVDPIAQFNLHNKHEVKSKTKAFTQPGSDDTNSPESPVSSEPSTTGIPATSLATAPTAPSGEESGLAPSPPTATTQHSELCRQLRLCVDEILMYVMNESNQSSQDVQLGFMRQTSVWELEGTIQTCKMLVSAIEMILRHGMSSPSGRGERGGEGSTFIGTFTENVVEMTEQRMER